MKTTPSRCHWQISGADGRALISLFLVQFPVQTVWVACKSGEDRDGDGKHIGMIRRRSQLPQRYWRTPLTDTFTHFSRWDEDGSKWLQSQSIRYFLKRIETHSMLSVIQFMKDKNCKCPVTERVIWHTVPHPFKRLGAKLHYCIGT